MTEKRTSVAGGSLLLGGSTLFQLLANLAIAIAVSRTLGAAGKGELALLQQFPAVAVLVLGLGFAGANAFFVGRGTHAPRQVVSDSLAFAALVSLIGVPATVLLMRLFVPALAAVPTATLALAAAAVPALIAGGLLSGVLTGLGRLKGAALSQVLAAATGVALVGAWLGAGQLSVRSVLLASLAGSIVALAVALGASGAQRLVRPSLTRVKERWGYARKSYVTTLTGYLELRQDVLLLGILSSASGVGIYSVGASLAELLWYVPRVTATPLMARAYQESAEEGARIAATIARLMTAFMLVATVGLALVVGPLVVAVFGEQFAPAAGVFLVLAPGIVAAGISGQLSAFLSTQGRLFPGIAALGLVVNLVLNVATIPYFGYWGAAASTTVSYTIGAAYIIHTYARTTGIRVRDVLVARPADIAFARAALRALRTGDGA